MSSFRPWAERMSSASEAAVVAAAGERVVVETTGLTAAAGVEGVLGVCVAAWISSGTLLRAMWES